MRSLLQHLGVLIYVQLFPHWGVYAARTIGVYVQYLPYINIIKINHKQNPHVLSKSLFSIFSGTPERVHCRAGTAPGEGRFCCTFVNISRHFFIIYLFIYSQQQSDCTANCSCLLPLHHPQRKNPAATPYASNQQQKQQHQQQNLIFLLLLCCL